ncbi:MAG: 5'/3'-nucleotidase SurE [Trichocoleus desertorum ATA4-8-CV12]|jgi:5'-nucleotidase|nr:5'/3'-nucleotidase SurE [Trichocoleus desertorum ATA4-8-CV12]
MTLILTNDDGIDAPGIRALQKAVNGAGVVVAPKLEWSGCGHRVTTTTPIHIEQRSPAEYAIGGTPADCVRVGISHLFPKVQFVLSGINAGGNLGADVYISGTVAAVREAALHGIPGVAISHYRKGRRPVDWDRAARWTAQVLVELHQRPLELGRFWNVNLPHLEPSDPDPEMVFCDSCKQPLPIDYGVEGDSLIYKGEYSKRDRTPGSDVDVCFSGKIAITQLHL